MNLLKQIIDPRSGCFGRSVQLLIGQPLPYVPDIIPSFAVLESVCSALDLVVIGNLGEKPQTQPELPCLAVWVYWNNWSDPDKSTSHAICSNFCPIELEDLLCVILKRSDYERYFA